MFEFLQNLDALHQGFWYIAIVTSLIFLVQTILTFVGSDTTDSLNADFDGHIDADAPFQLFSLRNLINFLLGFGWTGVAFYETIENKGFLIALAVAVGLMFLFLFFLLISQILKLTEDNTFKIENLVGKTGEVYLTIPEKMTGNGKILISLNGSNHELQAMTDSLENLISGTHVKVTSVKDKILIVSKI